MIIADFLVKCIFVFIRRYGSLGVEASLVPLSMFLAFPLVFLSSFSAHQLGFSLYDLLSTWGVVALAVLYYLVLLRFFRTTYVRNGRGATVQFKSILEIVLYMIAGVALFVLSTFLAFFTMRYF